MISIHNLTKFYSTNGSIQECLTDLTLQVKKGEFTAIVGRSGTGKTTLFRILSGLELDYSGSYKFDGEDTADFSNELWLEKRRMKIGVIFQDYNLISRLTVGENVLLAAQLKGKPCTPGQLDQILDSLEILDKRDQFPHQLSGGEKQRAAIARVLLQNPELILADEPTGNLDPETAEKVFGLLEKLHAEGKTILLVTHDLELAARTRRVLVLEDGKVHS